MYECELLTNTSSFLCDFLFFAMKAAKTDAKKF